MLSYLTNKYIKKEFYVRNNSRLGTDGPTKMDEFLEKFQKGGWGSFPIKKFILQIFAIINGSLVMNSGKIAI